MPRVLRIFNRFILGGPVLNAMVLSKYLEPDYETLLITGDKEPGEQTADHLIQQYGIQPVFIPEMRRSILPTQDVRAYNAILKIIRDFKPDIVHTHAAKAGAVGRAAAFRAKVPVVLHTFHGHTFHSYFNRYVTQAFIQIERQLAQRSTRIIAISEMQKNELVHEFKICKESKIAVIPNGIDLSKFQTDLEIKRAAWRQKFNIPQDAILVGIVGRMAPVKNHNMFVDVVHEITKANDSPNLHFVIIGDGDTRKPIMHALDEKGIRYNYFPENPKLEKVLFTSWQTEMDEVYAGLDILCLTSLNEGTPISVIESQAAYKPVVSTHVGAVADTMLHEKSGYLVEDFNVKDFSEKVLRLITDQNLRSEMGKVGNDFVNRTYSHNRLVADMRNLYDSLL